MARIGGARMPAPGQHPRAQANTPATAGCERDITGPGRATPASSIPRRAIRAPWEAPRPVRNTAEHPYLHGRRPSRARTAARNTSAGPARGSAAPAPTTDRDRAASEPAAGRGARDCGYGDPAEDRVLRRDQFEPLRGCAAAGQDARPGPGRALKIAAQDGGVRTRAGLFEADDLHAALATLDEQMNRPGIEINCAEFCIVIAQDCPPNGIGWIVQP